MSAYDWRHNDTDDSTKQDNTGTATPVTGTTDRTIVDKIGATVLDKDASGIVVRYPDGSVTMEPANTINTLCFDSDLSIDTEHIDELTLIATATVDSEWGNDLSISADLIENRHTIQIGTTRVRVAGESRYDVIDTLISSISNNLDDVIADATSRLHIQLDEGQTSSVLTLFSELINDRVRREVVDQFTPLFTAGSDTVSVEPTDDGWIVGDRFLVTDNCEVLSTHTDETFVTTKFDIDGPATLGIPNTETETASSDASPTNTDSSDLTKNEFTLTEEELKFLASVTTLIDAEQYLDVRLFGQAGLDVPKPIETIASTVTVSNYRDDISGRYHGHSLDKHVISADVGVTDTVVDELVFNDFDHAGPHELLARRDEFEQANYDIFEPDVDPESAWTRINHAASGARITAATRSHIDEIASQ